MEGDKRKEGRRGQRMGEEGKGREKREKERESRIFWD